MTIFDDDIETCKKCGLDVDLCACGEIAKTEARIKVHIVKRKWGKLYTVIRGLDQREFDLRDLSTTLKTKLACGGSVKGDHIELQGNHEFRILQLLEKLGFDSDTIDLVKK
ncbi:MAG: stress response translation initiation inhibitor YciH [Candidatus Heimdallarchaeota archaeon]|nr:stress response translation initiation inhibitor YciH [Candidatus Heimdallarchaeota archaeon]